MCSNVTPGWSRNDAIDMLWTILSIHKWKHLTIGCNWSTPQYYNVPQNLNQAFTTSWVAYQLVQILGYIIPNLSDSASWQSC